MTTKCEISLIGRPTTRTKIFYPQLVCRRSPLDAMHCVGKENLDLLKLLETFLGNHNLVFQKPKLHYDKEWKQSELKTERLWKESLQRTQLRTAVIAFGIVGGAELVTNYPSNPTSQSRKNNRPAFPFRNCCVVLITPYSRTEVQYHILRGTQ